MISVHSVLKHFLSPAVTLNMLLGTLMAFRYSPVRQWPHRHFNYFGLHNVSGYLALSLAVVHPIVLLFD